MSRQTAAQHAIPYEDDCRKAQAAQRDSDRIPAAPSTLEDWAAKRTAELESANRELEAFSYTVAHELRAPLRLIDAHAHMLSEHHGGPSDHLEGIQRGVSQMSALIDGLLALSSASHGQIRFEQTALGDLAQQEINRIAGQTRDRLIQWHVGPLPSVMCYPGLMQQVFANLIDNALKFTRPRARTRIAIGAAIEDGQTCIFVRDNGVGFDMRDAGKLFSVFACLHRQDGFEGTGIGLATVRRIIERHEGRIWAHSTVGAGTEFRFTFHGL
jgi:light-regulated signal transduction histidine kinase (bacteriophytochrome)